MLSRIALKRSLALGFRSNPAKRSGRELCTAAEASKGIVPGSFSN